MRNIRISTAILKDFYSSPEPISSLRWATKASSASIRAHRWRYARPKIVPEEVDIDRISFAGDAWSKPIGTVEAAIDSAKWSVAELLWNLNSDTKKTRNGYQTSLF